MPLSNVIAHRGASAYAPENTLVAFELAKEKGAHWVEFDVMLTVDSVPVVIHDDLLTRTTNGFGRVSQSLFADIQSLDAGSWFAEEFAGQTVPTLEQVILCLGRLNINANIELKPAKQQSIALATIVSEMIDSLWPEHLSAPIVSSFDWDCLREFRLHDLHTPIGVLMDNWQEDWWQTAEQTNAYSVHINQKHLKREYIEQIKQHDKKCLTYTVNDRMHALSLLSLGVDAVFSDFPDLLETRA